MIDQVILCWLRLYCVEFAQATAVKKNAPFHEMEYWDRRLCAAQRRYLRACETWARIRKHRVPGLQVNIGAKQVNVANAK